MKRIDFLKSAALLPAYPMSGVASNRKAENKVPVDFSLTGNRIAYRSRFQGQTKVIFLSDTHLWQSDAREDPYRQYSKRMAGGYNKTRHFKTGVEISPIESFEQTLTYAVTQRADLLILGGDIFSYPSEAAIEWALARLAATGLPFVYTAGNHDWHYEGMEGTSAQLRMDWSNRRLKALYQNENPLMAYRDVNGIRFLVFDNSTNEIDPLQLDFLIKQLGLGIPIVLAMHIPLHVPGASIHFGCGHPDWGSATDPSHVPERRQRWPESGHTGTTMEFHRRIFESSSIIGVLAGHVHEQSVSVYKGIPQFVAPANAAGGFYEIDFLSS